MVGAAGGIGGFFLPNVFGDMKWLTGSYGTGFALFGGLSILCVVLLWRLKGRWESTFLAAQSAAAPAGAAQPSESPRPTPGGIGHRRHGAGDRRLELTPGCDESLW